MKKIIRLVVHHRNRKGGAFLDSAVVFNSKITTLVETIRSKIQQNCPRYVYKNVDIKSIKLYDETNLNDLLQDNLKLVFGFENIDKIVQYSVLIDPATRYSPTPSNFLFAVIMRNSGGTVKTPKPIVFLKKLQNFL